MAHEVTVKVLTGEEIKPFINDIYRNFRKVDDSQFFIYKEIKPESANLNPVFPKFDRYLAFFAGDTLVQTQPTLGARCVAKPPK